MLELVDYNIKFLNLSWKWLNDPELKILTNTKDFTKEDQLNFYNNLSLKSDYYIYGIKIEGIEAGACGLKNVKNGLAEYWGYIGEKCFWRRGYGKKMLIEVQKKAATLGIKSLYLEVANENFIAKKLYLGAGFIVTDNINGFVLMKKIL